jgi:hypothetical protein
VTAEFRRLGKRGSYRLGQLRAQGIREAPRPVPFQPRFIRPYHRWPTSVWLLLLLGGSLIIAGAAAKGWWFAPFVVGVLAGLANWIGAWRLRVAVSALAIMAAVGWGAPLAWAVIRGQPYVAMARVIAGILGLPTSAVAGFGLTLLVAVVQALVGYWLGRALTPRPAPELAAEAVRCVQPRRHAQAPGHLSRSPREPRVAPIWRRIRHTRLCRILPHNAMCVSPAGAGVVLARPTFA